MKTNKIKALFIILIVFMALFLLTTKSNASSLSVSTSKSTVAPGESFTVNISVSGGAGYASVSASNGSLSSSSTGFLDNSSTSITCTAGSEGTVSISVSGVIADYESELDENKSSSASVSVVAPSSSANTTTSTKPTEKVETKKSDDSRLKTLSIDEGTISPEFSSGNKEYSLDVPNEITALTINAETNSTKANYSIEGNSDFQVGENTVKIIVIAEDGTKSVYTITVNRANPKLALQSLKITYIDEEGSTVEVPLTPEFAFDVLEYKLDLIKYTIKNLDIEAISNIEGAEVNIIGNTDLQEGENKIVITLLIPAETSEETGEIIKEEEKIEYTITFEKEAEPLPPTFWQKIKNWFTGVFGGVGNWFNNNSNQIQSYALIFCSAVFFGLSIYLVFDYKKYKKIVNVLSKIGNMNNKETITETSKINETNEEIKNDNVNIETKKKTGRHF